jgi:hypothetical protein
MPALDQLRKTTPKAKHTDRATGGAIHDLFHFSVTTLISAGIDVLTVAERVGHGQASMALDRYATRCPISPK